MQDGLNPHLQVNHALPLSPPAQTGKPACKLSYPSLVQPGPGDFGSCLDQIDLRRLVNSRIATGYCSEFLAVF